MVIKVAILGASGIGKFHSREFHHLGAKVVAILGSSKKSSEKTANMLKRDFGIDAKPYHELKNMTEKEILDAVSICTPPKTHFYLAKKCLEFGLNVFCEKPFTENLEEAKELLTLAKINSCMVTVNTQWPSVLNSISYDHIINNFEMYMEPEAKGKNMILDHIPHLNSMLIKLGGIGTIDNLTFLKKTDEELEITFDYKANFKISAKYHLKHKSSRPRKLYFKINDKEFLREIGKNYSQSLVSKGTKTNIEDPLKVSIRTFLESLNGNCKPLVSNIEILQNINLQKIISKGWEE